MEHLASEGSGLYAGLDKPSRRDIKWFRAETYCTRTGEMSVAYEVELPYRRFVSRLDEGRLLCGQNARTHTALCMT